MKPVLILGLGNPLMGDDGVGYRVAELLADDARLPVGAEAMPAGTDLLRWIDEIPGRNHVILVDAILGNAAGDIKIFHDDFGELSVRQASVHSLSVPQAVALIRMTLPAPLEVRFTLVGVGIESIKTQFGLSPRTAAKVPAILDAVLMQAISEDSFQALLDRARA